MNKLKIGIPATLFALSSFAAISCNNKTSEAAEQQKPKVETTIQSSPKDEFVKKSEKEEPWWVTALICVAGTSVLAYFYRQQVKMLEKIQQNEHEARTYLDMCGDNYLDYKG